MPNDADSKIARRVVARSFGVRDIPGVFWLVLDLNERAASGLAQGTLKGLKGISGNRRIVLTFLSVAGDSMLIMPGKPCVQANQLTRVMYDNPHYLASNNLAVAFRLMNKNPRRDGYEFIKSLTEYAMKAMGSSKRFTNLRHQIDYGTLSRDFYGDAYKTQTPKLETIHDLARWYKRTTLQIAQERKVLWAIGEEHERPTEHEWAQVLESTLREIGRIYAHEGEWIVKSDEFRIPSGSKMIVMRPKEIPQPYIDAYFTGGLDAVKELGKKQGIYQENANESLGPYGGFKWSDRWTWENFIPKLELLKQHGLLHKYRVSFVDANRYEQTRTKLLRR